MHPSVFKSLSKKTQKKKGPIVPGHLSELCLEVQDNKRWKGFWKKLYRHEWVSDQRPISLSNTVLKLVLSAACSRLQLILDKIISPNQRGFIKSRNVNSDKDPSHLKNTDLSKPSLLKVGTAVFGEKGESVKSDFSTCSSHRWCYCHV